MKITCIQCQAVYSIDDSLLTADGIKAQCPACGDIQVVRTSDSDGSEQAPAPAGAPADDLDALAATSAGAQPETPAGASAPKPESPPPLPTAPPPLPVSESPLPEAKSDSLPPASAGDDLFSSFELDGSAAPAPSAPAEPAPPAVAAGGQDPFGSLDLDIPNASAPVADSSSPEAELSLGTGAAVDSDPFADLGLPPAPAASASVDSGSAAADMPPLPGIEGPAAGGGGQNADEPLPQAAPGAAAAAVDSPATRCERCGGLIASGGSPNGMCERCRDLSSGDKGALEDREWRVQKPDGVIYGPLTLAEVKDKFSAGEVSAADKVARAEGEFKLISSFAEFATFFQRPSQVFKSTFRAPPPPSHMARNLIVVVLFVLVGAAVGAYFMFPEYFAFESDELDSSVVEDALLLFEQDVSNPQGSSAENVTAGRKLMMRDDHLSYLEADHKLKAALILDPANPDAFAGWVQNRALLDTGASDVTQRKVALDLIAHALGKNPNHTGLLRARAYLLLSLGQTKEARDTANKVLAMTDEDPETMLVLGATYLDASTELAVDYFTKAQKINPELNLSYRLMGEAKIRLGKFHEALSFFSKRLENDPTQYASLDALARVYLAVGKFDKTRGVYERILGGEPERVEAAVSLSQLQAQIFNRPRSALKLLDSSLKQGDDKISSTARAQLLAEKSSVLRVMGRTKEAQEAVQEALELDPMLVPALYSQASLSLRSGDLGKAIVQLRALRSHLPDEPRVILHIAEAEAQIPHYETALKQFKLAVEASPHDLDAVLMVASLQLELDNPNLAYSWLRRATKIDPFHERTHRHITHYFDGPGLLKSSVERARKTSEKYADDPLALALAGAVFWRSGQSDRALTVLYRSLSMDEECFAANFYLGSIFLGQGKARKAMPFLKQAHKADGLHNRASVMLAYALLQTGRSAKAEKMVKSALKSDPGDLSGKLCLAEIQLARKKRKAAIATLLKVYEGDNENLRAKELLFNLGY